MRVAWAMALALLRCVRTPGVVLATWIAVLALAAFAVEVDVGALRAAFARLPGGLDPVLVDEVRHSTESGLGLGTALATLLALALFSIAGAALALVTRGAERRSAAALGKAWRRSARILATMLLGMLWLALASLAGRVLIMPAAAALASRLEISEWRCLVAGEIASLLLLAPGVVAADLARARIMLVDVRGFAAPFLGALRSVLTQVGPWVALLVALALETLLAEWFAGQAAELSRVHAPAWVYEIVPALFVLVRVLLYAAYVGGVASTIEIREEGSGH